MVVMFSLDEIKDVNVHCPWPRLTVPGEPILYVFFLIVARCLQFTWFYHTYQTCDNPMLAAFKVKGQLWNLYRGWYAFILNHHLVKFWAGLSLPYGAIWIHLSIPFRWVLSIGWGFASYDNDNLISTLSQSKNIFSILFKLLFNLYKQKLMSLKYL